MVPSTTTSVPVRIATVTRSPSRMTASTVEISGARFRIAAETEAPTFWIPATRKSRPAAVPTTPDATKYGAACQLYSSRGTRRRTAAHSPTAPTATLSQKPA